MIQKSYNASMPSNACHEEMMKLCVYGIAFNDYKKHYEKDYNVSNVQETWIDNQKAECKTLRVDITLSKKGLIN